MSNQENNQISNREIENFTDELSSIICEAFVCITQLSSYLKENKVESEMTANKIITVNFKRKKQE